jgi:small GTP-binding protein
MVISDTKGSEDYDRIRSLTYPDANCFVLCFSLVNRNSFENISTRWIPEILHYNPLAPIILIGTKKDLTIIPQVKIQSHNAIQKEEVGKIELTLRL